MRTDAQRRANIKYERKTYSILTCKLKKEEAAAFKEKLAREGKTVNGKLIEFIKAYLGEN